PCVGEGEITEMTLDATIGSYCQSWYDYSIYVNGVLIETNQCNQTGYDLSDYLPINEVELRSTDNDNYSDYTTLSMTLNITYSTIPCAGTPDPGITTTTLESACPDVSFTLGLENETSGVGISYQWQISSDGHNWENAGPDASIWTTTQNFATFYMCEVTCAETGAKTTSTPIYVSINTSGCPV